MKQHMRIVVGVLVPLQNYIVYHCTVLSLYSRCIQIFSVRDMFIGMCIISALAVHNPALKVMPCENNNIFLYNSTM